MEIQQYFYSNLTKDDLMNQLIVRLTINYQTIIYLKI